MLSKRTLKLKYYVNIKAGLSLLKSNYGVCFNVAYLFLNGSIIRWDYHLEAKGEVSIETIK